MDKSIKEKNILDRKIKKVLRGKKFKKIVIRPKLRLKKI